MVICTILQEGSEVEGKGLFGVFCLIIVEVICAIIL